MGEGEPPGEQKRLHPAIIIPLRQARHNHSTARRGGATSPPLDNAVYLTLPRRPCSMFLHCVSSGVRGMSRLAARTLRSVVDAR